MFGIAILAAGKGKRMKSFERPKVLIPLLTKPLIGYVLETALKLKPEKLYIIVGFKKDLVIDFIQSNFNDSRIEFVEQFEQLGTGHAIQQIEEVFDPKIEHLLVLSGDVPLISYQNLSKFLDFHIDGNYDLSLISTKVENPTGYGRIVRSLEGDLLGIVEHKDLLPKQEYINEINAGIYLIKTKDLFEYLKLLKNDNAQKEYYLTDIVKMYLDDKLNVGVFFIEDPIELLGINTEDELKYLENLLILRMENNMIKGINHIGIAVSNLENSMNLFKNLFNVQNFHLETVEAQKVQIASFRVGNVLIELTAATDEDSPISKFIQKKGEGIHHIAFEVEGIQLELDRLKQSGVSLINEKPVEGAHDMEIAFIHPKSTNGVLIEFCQPKNILSNKE